MHPKRTTLDYQLWVERIHDEGEGESLPALPEPVPLLADHPTYQGTRRSETIEEEGRKEDTPGDPILPIHKRYAIKYKFYEKGTASHLCTLASNASSWIQKKSTLSQEVVRRLLNTSTDLPSKDKQDILENFIRKLRASGYNTTQIQEIVGSGILGYNRKWVAKPDRHRRSKDTQQLRRMKKLLGKTTWFRFKEKEEGREVETHQRHPTKNNWRGPVGKNTKIHHQQPSSVLFVERTRGGELASKLKEVEEEINNVSRKKVRVVEKNRTQVNQSSLRWTPGETEHAEEKVA